MASRNPIHIYDYLDYREFLRDFYIKEKGAQRGFSYRAFSRRAGLTSPNYLQLVMKGERSIKPAMAAKFAKACRLDGDEGAYFQDLVAFNQADTAVERNTYYRRLTGFRHYRRAHKLDLAQAAYHAQWYIPAIRELAVRKDFVADPAWISRLMIPSISKEQAEQALQILFELQLLVRDDQGRVVQTHAAVSTGRETQRLHVMNYHRAMADRAMESVDLIPAAERDISALTLCIASDSVTRYKERLVRFRQELVELSAGEQDPDRVIQINFHLFPLTKQRGGNKR